ncbi:MAG: hypothetical protein KDB72_20980 [Mycobacterium sp.]|nr:hypothetical protein [Mycobacterium sp.]
MNLRVGDRVRIERDETRYPSKGTWPSYRGKAGTVVTINADAVRPHLTEYGIAFGTIRARADGSLYGGMVTWFRRHELS